MQGDGHGRVDRVGRWPYGVWHLVSLVAVLLAVVSPPAFAGDVYVGTYSSQSAAVSACKDHAPSSEEGECGWHNIKSGPGTDGTDWAAMYTTSSNTYWFGFYDEGVCPDGTTETASGECFDAPTETQTNLNISEPGQKGCLDGAEYQAVGVGVRLGTEGDMLMDWEPTGNPCPSGAPDLIPNDNPAGPGCVTGDSGAEYCASDQPDKSCGTFNGEAVCASALPNGGSCMVGADGTNTCGAPGYSEVTPPHDPATEHFEVPPGSGPETMEFYDALNDALDSAMTLQQGTIQSGGNGLDTEQPDIAGDGEGPSEDVDGDGKDDDLPPGFCEDNPEMCDLDDGLEEGSGPEVPEDSIDLSNMTDNYSSGIASTAECPAITTIQYAGTSFDFEWSAFCDFADMIRPFVIAAGWFAAWMFGVRALA